jgi:aspartate/methionine/tyrosine aminotransferase
MHALLGPGDHAVVLAPNYQSAEEVPRSICETSAVALRWQEGGGWTLDLDDVDAACRPNTKLFAINFPNNPTGAMPPLGQYEELLRMAAARGACVLSDEVYRGLERDGITPLPQAADLSARALSLGVMSKAYGLPGLRIGWIACRDAEVLRRMERMRHYLSICSAGPSEALATIALDAREIILDRNCTIARGNLELLAGFFARHERIFEWYVPPGSCVSYPRYLGADGVEAFCRRAIRDAGLLLLPASIFQSALVPTPTDRFRIGFGRRNLREAVHALDAFIATDAAASA